MPATQKNISESDPNHKLLLLAECFLFRNLNMQELAKLVEGTSLRTAEKDEVVLQKYDQSKEMYIIVSGKVSLTTSLEDGKALSFGILGAGNIFGEMALFDNKERSATITALEPCKFLIIQQLPLVKFITENPKIALKLLAAMTVRLRYANQTMEEKFFGQVNVRLARKIVALAKIYGETSIEGLKISIKLSRGELAKSIGTSTDTVVRQIKKWQQKGVLNYENGTLLIFNFDHLKSLTV